jgi:hypothetical protein
MRWKNFFTVIFLTAICLHAIAGEDDSTERKRNFLPSTAHLQFAGFIGMFSAGVGYQVKNEWANFSLLYGYVPEKYSTADIHTIALKTTAILFRTSKSAPVIPALYLGCTLNMELSGHSFFFLPDQFPKGYYHPQAIHSTFFLGLKTRFALKENTAIEPFFEVGALDYYLWYAIDNETIHIKDVSKAAIGLNYILR